MAKVTVRFFKIEKVHDTAPNLEVALQSVFASGEKASQREKNVVGQILRMERLKNDNTFVEGEVVRKQIGDIPPEANDDGLQKLSVSEGGGIGHCIAFRYNPALQVLAIQFDNRAVSVNRLLMYLRAFDPNYEYRAELMLRKDAWTKYNRGLPTKFSLSVAQPQNLKAVEGTVGSVIESTRRLAEIADGPVITIEVKMGRKKGSLAKDTIDSVLQYFANGGGATEDLRKLQVTSANEDGSEAINFLKDLLKESTDIELPEGEPEKHYKKRRSWVKTCFEMHFQYINGVYGASNVVED